MRAKKKLDWAIEKFGLAVEGKICADFGSATGGFVQSLLNHGASKVYAVEVGYGVLAWDLRKDRRVVVRERTNALWVKLPEKVDLITIDVSWTKQEKVLPNARRNLKEGGGVVSLIKPHYETGKAVLSGQEAKRVLEETIRRIVTLGWEVEGVTESPVVGKKGGNREYLVLWRNAKMKQ